MRSGLGGSIAVAVVLTLAGCSNTTTLSEDRGSRPTAAASATRDEASPLSGTVEGWLSEICLHGYYEEVDLRYRLPLARGGLACSIRRDLVSGGGHTAVYVGYYPTMTDLDQDVRTGYPPVWRVGPNARGYDPQSGQFVVFAMESGSSNRALYPLKRFGFALSRTGEAPPAASPAGPAPALNVPNPPPAARPTFSTAVPTVGAGLSPNERQFIESLAVLGLKPKKSPEKMVEQGLHICSDVFNGRTQEFVANRFYAYNADLGGQAARDVVAAAIENLCPSATAKHNPPPNPTFYFP